MMSYKLVLRLALLLALFLGVAETAVAQTGFNADVMKNYGGVYAIDCANPQSPRLRVEPQAMAVEQGNLRLVAQQVQAAYSYFGQSPPAGYLVALMGQVKQQHSLLFVVYGDAKGQYIRIDGDKPVLVNLGPVLARASYRSCDAATNQRVAGQARQEQQAQKDAQKPVAAGQAKYPSELIRDPRFKAAYLKALGPLARERWLTAVNGPAPELAPMRLEGADYQMAAFCKPHDCGDNNAVMLYDAAGGRVQGLVYQGGRASLVGGPSRPLAGELERIWRQQWRQGR